MRIEERLIETKYRPAGFDYLRISLALAVFMSHTIIITYGDSAANYYLSSWRRPFAAFILPMFFALSGFLVAGSLVRTKSFFVYFGLRAIRIVPALAVEVLLCAFILGPIFTARALPEYFTSHQFFIYFLNIVGDVHFTLPGVFATNPHPFVVNEQLWTVPWELQCYIVMAAIAVVGAVQKKALMLVIAIGFSAAVLGYGIIDPPQTWVSVHGIVLVESFVAGITLFVYRRELSLSKGLFLASLVTMCVLFLMPYGDYLVSFPAGYVTVYLGMQNPPRNKIVLSGDYSYGIYLYGFPIQQAVAAAMPTSRSLLGDVCIALPLTLLVAVSSWHYIEKPALLLRSRLPILQAYFESRIKRAFSKNVAAKTP